MDENRFWDVVEQSLQGADGSQDAQAGKLQDILSQLDKDEVASFDGLFNQMRLKAYTWDLWGAAYIINGGCSDDGFEYFRCALIAAGKEKFEAATKDAESLADWIEDDYFEFEAFWYVAPTVYTQKSGSKEWPKHKLVFPKEPAGQPWEEDGDDLEKRFPKLWAKFSNQ